MEVEQYRAAQEWLISFVEYSTAIEIDTAAESDMRKFEVGLSDILFVIKDGQICWADREHDGCRFIVIGRNCDDEEITVQGRFESATEFVVINRVSKSRAER
jgi:hypothetical protein